MGREQKSVPWPDLQPIPEGEEMHARDIAEILRLGAGEDLADLWATCVAWQRGAATDDELEDAILSVAAGPGPEEQRRTEIIARLTEEG